MTRWRNRPIRVAAPQLRSGTDASASGREGDRVAASRDELFTRRACGGAHAIFGRETKQRIDNPSPRHSMYGMYAYIGVVWGVNVGIYGIHGASGSWSDQVVHRNSEADALEST